MTFYLLTILSLLGALHTTVGGGGPIPDCFADVIGTRGGCMGACVLDNLQLISTDLPKSCQTVATNFISGLTCTDSTCQGYQYIYDRAIADRTKVCSLMDDISNCVDDTLEKACGKFGVNFVTSLRDFLKAHMDCSNPTALSVPTCVGNPELIGSPEIQTCVSEVLADSFITDLSQSSNDINALFNKLKDAKTDFCRLYTKVSKCFVDVIKASKNADKYCNADALSFIDKTVSQMEQLLGCTNEANYDLIECGLKILPNYNSINSKCTPVNAFSSIVSTLTPSCPMLTSLECLGEEVAKICSPTGWILSRFKDMMVPLKNYFDFKYACNSPKPTVIGSCGCFGDFSLGDSQPDTATCTVAEKIQKCTSDGNGGGQLRVTWGFGSILIVAFALFM